MTSMLNPLLLMAGGSTTVLIAGAWLYLADRHGRAGQQRISNIASAYARTGTPLLDVRRPWAGPTADAGLMGHLLAYANIEIDRPDLYPMPWWILAVIASMFSFIVASVGVFFIGPVAWVSLPLDAFLLVRMTFKFFQNRRTAQLYTQLPDALAMTVRSVRVGFTVTDALRIVSEEGPWPTTGEFRRVIDEIRLGGSLQDALVKLALRSQLLEYRFLAVALALQNQSGGSLSETLENLADVVRKRVALKERGIALASEARMTMWVLGVLPFVVAGALMIMTPDYLLVLVTTSMGKKLLFTGIALLCMGFGSMKIIIKKSVS